MRNDVGYGEGLLVEMNKSFRLQDVLTSRIISVNELCALECIDLQSWTKLLTHNPFHTHPHPKTMLIADCLAWISLQNFVITACPQ